MKVAVFFVGALHDGGFNSSALAGAEAAAGIADIEIVHGVPYDQAAILERLRRLVPGFDAVVFVGGQGNHSMPQLAAEHPDRRFAIIQGHETAANLASYNIRQEDSAFLAGCLAARLSNAGVVGHLSGHKVSPGLRGRAAFVGGARHVKPDVTILTGFCGTQDDGDVAEAWMRAEIEAGADIVFTMLNGARGGAIAACRDLGALQIGNALDWCVSDPDVFIASALARIDLGVERAIRDLVEGDTPGGIVEFGLGCEGFVSLAMRDDVPATVRNEIAGIEAEMRAGRIVVPCEYAGPEFLAGAQA